MWIVAGGEVKARRYMHGNGVLWGLYIECVLGNDRDMIGGAHTLWFNVYGFLKFYEGRIAILGQSLQSSQHGWRNRADTSTYGQAFVGLWTMVATHVPPTMNNLSVLIL